jgi:hypothetical protein
VEDIFNPANCAPQSASFDLLMWPNGATLRSAMRSNAFDRISLTPDQLRVSADEIASAQVSPEVDAALEDAIAHIRCL